MQGGWLWSWKDRIDRSFMNKFGSDLDFEAMQQQQPAAQQQQLPQALAASLSAEELAVLAGAKMRCGGCGSKVGASSLARALRRLQQGEHGLEGDSVGLALEAAADAGVLLGLGQPDDAAVLEPPPAGHVTVSAAGSGASGGGRLGVFPFGVVATLICSQASRAPSQPAAPSAQSQIRLATWLFRTFDLLILNL